MADVAQIELLAADEVAARSRVATAANGLRYSAFGELRISSDDLLHILEAVPASVVERLGGRVYCFVPLTLSEDDAPRLDKAAPVRVAPTYTSELADRATCHRDLTIDATEYTFISSRLMHNRFALAFELFINIGHQFVEVADVPSAFAELAWAQARADVRGETSLDAFEHRKSALSPGASSDPIQITTRRASKKPNTDDPSAPPTPDESRDAFFAAVFADALAIYMLSLAMDVDYADLRERDYPLLAPAALADRLRILAQTFPAGPGYDFAIRYRRRF